LAILIPVAVVGVQGTGSLAGGATSQIGGQILIISPLLTIYRVAEGKAFSSARQVTNTSAPSAGTGSRTVPSVSFSPESQKHLSPDTIEFSLESLKYLSPDTTVNGLESEKSSV
jgi:hypothetical protein